MPYSLLIGLGAGFVSAVVFVSAVTGLSLVHVLLFLLTPLVLFLAGFGAGTAAVRIAAITGTAMIFAVGGAQLAFIYAAFQALPVVALTHFAGLNRDVSGSLEWYPAGRIILAAALIASLLSVVSLASVGTDLDTVHSAIRDATTKFVEDRVPTIPGAPTLGAGDIDAIAREAVQMMPSLIALFVMTYLLVNMWIAARITLASGRLQRPWPDLSTISFPRATPLLLLAATLVAATGGYIGLCAKAFAATLVLAYILVTFAIMHFVTRGNPWRVFLLLIVYVLPLMLLVVLAGAGLQVSFWAIAVLFALPGLVETAWPIRKLPAS